MASKQKLIAAIGDNLEVLGPFDLEAVERVTSVLAAGKTVANDDESSDADAAPFKSGKSAKVNGKAAKSAAKHGKPAKAAKPDKANKAEGNEKLMLAGLIQMATKLQVNVPAFLKAKKATSKAKQMEVLDHLVQTTLKTKKSLGALQKLATKSDIKVSLGRGKATDEVRAHRVAAQLIAAGVAL